MTEMDKSPDHENPSLNDYVKNPSDVAEDTASQLPSRKKPPKRVLHFSDGILEEYSSEDEEEGKSSVEDQKAVVDPKTLRMLPWLLWLTLTAGTRFVSACDTAGEKLAWWLGITSPKYYYEIQEAEKMKEEERERKEKEDIEMAGWKGTSEAEGSTVVSPPSTSSTN
uniref:Protein FAM177A1-like protein n=1 Tax=Pseudodiaptomus poplesia TaxID=213370 RepID=A0A0U2KDQ9_9MAXI|nr:protein FAM177A1-like protein [Pseudodiaptomus poplesia]